MKSFYEMLMILESGNSADLFHAVGKVKGKEVRVGPFKTRKEAVDSLFERHPDATDVMSGHGLNQVASDIRWHKNENYDPVSMRHQQLGEDEGSPYHLEVDIDNDDWRCISSIWVKDYVPNGSENPLSRPRREKKWNDRGEEGTTFENPGKNLGLLPDSIRAKAIDWVDKEVDEMLSKYDPNDRRDFGDDRDEWIPNWGVHGREPGYYRAGDR